MVITVDGALPDSQLIAVPLGDIFSIPCAAPSYLERHGVPERPEDLHAHRCLRMAYPMYEGDWVFPQGVDQCVIAPRDNFSTNVADAMLVASELGMGIGLLPFYTASQAIEQGACAGCWRRTACAKVRCMRCTRHGITWMPRCGPGSTTSRSNCRRCSRGMRRWWMMRGIGGRRLTLS